ncbi:LysR family transcriptional regulator [Exilibacterium tricleocarpae]|uniref:LysR family transcriptional regulator n=1 Tax=Exilibacterium tricleocarpae TaxID=2591008 RepID=A0A545TVK7_9GAMM|nr:LysR substrate-binding domain-containing protein [Exilibacterium tricleocarpae]TQV81244.1 LysR family transcriptional regulator [Exilibacterium tricleocarpae]
MQTTKVTIDELVLFNAIVANGSFSRAADSLNLAASVVSRSLKRLETKLGSSLLNRTTRNISLTQEGQWLFDRAAGIIAGINAIEAHFLEETGRPRGIVRVDAATPFTLHAIAPLIAGFNERYPDITVVLESSESTINLIERKVDIAVRIGELESSSLTARKIGDTYRGIYAAPGYIERRGVPGSAADLRDHCCLGFTKPEKLNTWPVLGPDKTPLAVTPAVLADSGESLRQLALQGNGIACLSAFTVRRDVKAGRLIPLLKNKLLDMPIPVSLVYYADNAASERVRSLIDYIAEHIDLCGQNNDTNQTPQMY